MSTKIKAISLVSGGLDSTLATKVILDQGIEVVAVNFLTPFCLCNKRGGCRHEAKHLAETLGIEIRLIYVFKEYLEIIKNPKFGYGSNLNPCIDCRILMLRKTKEFMSDIGASFIITGEVLGQRPMSQHQKALKLIEKEAGLEGLILRPLSAKLLSETIPEKKGWINRDKMLDFCGRGRKPQMLLAKQFGINDYPCPAGGCLLTDTEFSRRLKDLLVHSEDSQFNLNDIELLKLGRHLRLGPKSKLIVGRDEVENNKILHLAIAIDYIFEPIEVKGPIAIGRGEGFNDFTILELAGSILTRYCDRDTMGSVKIKCRQAQSNQIFYLNCFALEEERLKALRINF
jgi:tRNA U34 2-thiouridine synthase MnmA/TrmU